MSSVLILAAAALVAGAFLLGKGRRPVIRTKSIPLALLGLLARLTWWLVKFAFRFSWTFVRMSLGEVRSW